MVMLRIGAVVLNTGNSTSEVVGGFWAEALGCARGSNPDFLIPRAGGAARLHVDDTDRTHLDLWTDSAAEQRCEVDRLVGLGASRVDWDYPDDADFVVLRDPGGTLFCVIDTSA